MKTDIQITDQELLDTFSALRKQTINGADDVPDEIVRLGQHPRILEFAQMTMYLSLVGSPRIAIADQMAICLYIGCTIGRAQATRELCELTFGDAKDAKK